MCVEKLNWWIESHPFCWLPRDVPMENFIGDC